MDTERKSSRSLVLTYYRRDGYVIIPRLLPRGVVLSVQIFLRVNFKEPCDLQGHFPQHVRLHSLMQLIPEFLASRALLFDLLETEKLYCHWPPMARCVLPDNDAALWPLHKDTEYNPHIKGDFLTVWLPMVPIDEKCGGLTLPKKPLVPLEPGDAVILSKDCLHASMPNKSDRPRLSCDFRFFGEDATSTKHYLDLQTGEIVKPC